jgi:hypothetical protein
MGMAVPDQIKIGEDVLLSPKFNKAFYAISDQNGVALGTTWSVLTWDIPIYADSGFAENGGIITVEEVLNNARARIDCSVSCGNATNNTLMLVLSVDPDGQSGFSNVRAGACYAGVGGTIDLFHYLRLNTDMKLRTRARISGALGATIASLGTQIAIETKAEII